MEEAQPLVPAVKVSSKLSTESRRARAKARQEAAVGRTPQQQLQRLDQTFGPGQGAAKERAKLASRIRKASEKKGPAEAQKSPSDKAARGSGKGSSQPAKGS